MQDYELSLQHVLWRIERLHQKKEVVTKLEQGVHRMTNAEMVPRINRLAGALKRLGVKPGDRVATLAFNNHRHLELYYAVPCMGAVLHTLNLRLFPQHLEFIINDAEDKTLFVDQALLPLLKPLMGKIPSIQRFVLMTDASAPSHNQDGIGEMLDYEALLQAESDSYPWPKLSERMAAAMCYTSGTTGNPKGVVYSHRSQFIHTMGVLQTDNLGLTEKDTVLPIVPMFHANSWGLPYACGMAGSKVLFPDRFMGDAKSIVDLAEEEGATILAGVPTIWINTATYLKESGRRLPKVKSVICGGSAIPRSLMESMDSVGLRMLHAWGMTETSPLGSVPRPPGDTKPDDELAARLPPGAIVPGVELRICDAATGDERAGDGVASRRDSVHRRGPQDLGRQVRQEGIARERGADQRERGSGGEEVMAKTGVREHSIAHDTFHYKWDNSLPPAVEIESGDIVNFDTEEVTSGQLKKGDDASKLGALHCDKLYPLGGPVFVKAAEPADSMEVW